MGPHLHQERLYAIDRSWVYELPIIEPDADPQIVHKSREAEHHRGNSPRSAKFITKQESDLKTLQKTMMIHIRLMGIEQFVPDLAFVSNFEFRCCKAIPLAKLTITCASWLEGHDFRNTVATANGLIDFQ